jgi:peptide/nickel transport system permease protein
MKRPSPTRLPALHKQPRPGPAYVAPLPEMDSVASLSAIFGNSITYSVPISELLGPAHHGHPARSPLLSHVDLSRGSRSRSASYAAGQTAARAGGHGSDGASPRSASAVPKLLAGAAVDPAVRAQARMVSRHRASPDGRDRDLETGLRSLILPALALGLPLAAISRARPPVRRSSKTLGEDFIRTARAQGA